HFDRLAIKQPGGKPRQVAAITASTHRRNHQNSKAPADRHTLAASSAHGRDAKTPAHAPCRTTPSARPPRVTAAPGKTPRRAQSPAPARLPPQPVVSTDPARSPRATRVARHGRRPAHRVAPWTEPPADTTRGTSGWAAMPIA